MVAASRGMPTNEFNDKRGERVQMYGFNINIKMMRVHIKLCFLKHKKNISDDDGKNAFVFLFKYARKYIKKCGIKFV